MMTMGNHAEEETVDPSILDILENVMAVTLCSSREDGTCIRSTAAILPMAKPLVSATAAGSECSVATNAEP